MRRHLSTFRLLALCATLAVSGAACGGGGSDATKAEFIDHAVEISNADGDADQEARVREVFDCLWPQIRDDEALLGRFMDATAIDEGLSADMSKLMVSCVTGGGETP